MKSFETENLQCLTFLIILQYPQKVKINQFKSLNLITTRNTLHETYHETDAIYIDRYISTLIKTL